jgi:DNA-directed RNA polymerase beta subunit
LCIVCYTECCVLKYTAQVDEYVWPHSGKLIRMGMQGTKVFLNGRWIGVNRNPDGLKKALLKLRRADSISNDVSIVYDHALNEIRVNNDWGRVCRPLFVVEDGKIKLTKHEVKQIKVRFLSPVL